MFGSPIRGLNKADHRPCWDLTTRYLGYQRSWEQLTCGDGLRAGLRSCWNRVFSQLARRLVEGPRPAPLSLLYGDCAVAPDESCSGHHHDPCVAGACTRSLYWYFVPLCLGCVLVLVLVSMHV
ncbi:uncharacterized protein BO95DRAFT_84703 [Aspergillus brunneoviolaceus CBS 621.78]|uniref:Uncharacterized protein n=1 Tax=Aspergillus brunneoviolaceus CBS 621.78 TaxID=1450534 RepID=A0ACD1GDX7_9EURO|nr:hypothetical protein BO95DRAFT_84703 [Aspergillus brunneoviolaceus CBS 621.78]RAH47451.1 hypothetical protein BO95DRAFT_84703 [Aspergillus brunneoviolaceus CBS 621.78]